MQIKIKTPKGDENFIVSKLVESIILDGGKLQALNFDEISREYTVTIYGIRPELFASVSGKAFDYTLIQ